MYEKLARLLLIGFDNVNGRCVYGCEKYLEKTQWMRKQDLHALQFRRLKALLRHADGNVPYYHDLFRRTRFCPSDLKSLDDLSRIPILGKSAIREQSDKLVALNFTGKRLVSWATSGTTAAPVRFYRDKKDLSWGIAAELRGYGWAGYTVGDRHGLIWRVHHDQQKSFSFKIKNFLMRNIVLDVNSLSERSMASFAKKMRVFKPQFMRGYATGTSVFAAFVLDNCRQPTHLRGIFTTSATLLPNYRRVIEDAFKCRVYDYYSSNEVSHIAAQCGQHEGLHVSDENVIVEVVKENGPVSPGEEGRVLVTNLNGYAMPFIRYDIGDLGRTYADKCSCGRELSLLKPTGRTYEYFVYSDGSFTVLRDFKVVLGDLPIQDFQVVQESYDEIVIKLVARPGFTEGHTRFILKNIKMGGSAKVRVDLVDSIPPEGSGKVKHIVSKIPTA